MTGGRKLAQRLSMLVVLAGIVYAGYVFWDNFSAASANIKVSVIGVLGVLLAGLVTHYYTRIREINARHFEQKRRAYEGFVNSLVNVLLQSKGTKKIDEKKLVSELIDVKRELIIWGGAKVIEAWIKWETNTSEEEVKSGTVILETERLLRAIREDLGHRDANLELGSISSLFLTLEGRKQLAETVRNRK